MAAPWVARSDNVRQDDGRNGRPALGRTVEARYRVWRKTGPFIPLRFSIR
jgi:hypothetical protein